MTEKKNNVKKISRVVFQPTRDFLLKLHVKLINDKKDNKNQNFHNLFVAPDGNGYLQLDLQSFLTLEIKDGDWSMDKSVMINERNIYQVIKGFEKAIDGIYNGGVFAISKQTGKTIIFKDKREEHTVRIYNMGMNQRLIVQPSIIYDYNDESTYEGVIIYVNRTENFIELPIDAFEALYYTLTQVNLFVYSQTLVNYYLSSIKNEGITTKEVEVGKHKPQKHPVSTVQDEVATSNIKKKKTDKEFFNFKK